MLAPMMTQAKAVLLQGLRASGAVGALARTSWRRDRLLVLCYHGISMRDEHEWKPGLFLSPERFEMRVRMLVELEYNVLPLAEAVERLLARSLPPRAVVITFDDGFADFGVRAWPVLARYRLPATLYLTTHYVFHRCAIFNLITPYMLWRARDRRPDAKPEFGWTAPPDLASAAGRDDAFRTITNMIIERKSTTEEKEELAACVAAHLELDYSAMRCQRICELLSPEEVTALSRENLDIQLHTHRHRSPERAELFEAEIRDNRAAIEQLTGSTPRHFCYPSGIEKPGMAEVLRASGVQSAVTCVAGLADSGADPLRIARFLDSHTVGEAAFESWLSGVAALLPNRLGNGAGSEYPYVQR